MRSWRRRATRRVPSDLGFTLIEVIVALVLLTMVTIGVATLFMRAVSSSSSLDRRQAAVSVAGQSMELVRSIPAMYDVSNHSKLLSGRYSVTVHNQFTSLTSTVDLSQTDEESDSTATVASTPVLPYTATATVAGVTYTAQRIVGSCWRPSAGGDCVKAASKATNSQKLFRVIVSVSWSEGGAGTSCSGHCHYDLSTLVDPAADPTFNPNATNGAWPAAPALQDISATTLVDTPITVDLATAVQQAGTPLTAAIVSTSSGTASVLPNTTRVTVTPQAGSTADITVAFSLTDPYSQTTQAHLTVHVNPHLAASNATVITAYNTAVAIDLSGYVSGGIGTRTYSRTNPPAGTLSALSGTSVTYTPSSNWSGTTTFTFTVTDSSGSTTATVTVVVNGKLIAGGQSVTCVKNKTVDIVLSANVTGGTAPLTYTTTTPGHATLTSKTSDTVTFTPNASWTGSTSFTFTVKDNAGVSAIATISVSVS